jgi:capsular exopolysaccharide synthesis family protein
MSWFYEALQRAERRSPQSERVNGEGFAGPDGDSFLAEIEMLSSLSEKIPSENADAQTQVAVSTEEAPSGTHVPVESDEAPPVASPEAQIARNGFRLLTLPLKESSRLIFQTDTHGMAAEQFRLLRRKLTQDFSAGGVLMVTSPTVGDGKTLTSINLCSCLAELGEPTLLIEADLRRPTVGRVLSCPLEAPGIETVLSGEAQPTDVIHMVEQLRFHVAMVARVPTDPSKLINGDGFRQFLAWARGHFRWIVLDSSPVLPAADVADLLPQADCALLVIRAGSTPRELSKHTVEILGKRLHGVILNEATVDSNAYYRYLTHYYQGPTKNR